MIVVIWQKVYLIYLYQILFLLVFCLNLNSVKTRMARIWWCVILDTPAHQKNEQPLCCCHSSKNIFLFVHSNICSLLFQFWGLFRLLRCWGGSSINSGRASKMKNSAILWLLIILGVLLYFDKTQNVNVNLVISAHILHFTKVKQQIHREILKKKISKKNLHYSSLFLSLVW